ncbi:hypothetical protein DQG13_18965 [Paenibacillus sp. YN15]|nr:hypothetical protein DQG13_18965 [Paenibacillus sp. YN15]
MQEFIPPPPLLPEIANSILQSANSAADFHHRISDSAHIPPAGHPVVLEGRDASPNSIYGGPQK